MNDYTNGSIDAAADPKALARFDVSDGEFPSSLKRPTPIVNSHDGSTPEPNQGDKALDIAMGRVVH